MKDNIIDFTSAKVANTYCHSKEIGQITISILLNPETNHPYFYLLPDREELLPIVDLLEDSLLKHIFVSH